MNFLKTYWFIPVLLVIMIGLEIFFYDSSTGTSPVADGFAALICGSVILWKSRRDFTLMSLYSWSTTAYVFLTIVFLVFILRVVVPHMPASWFEGGTEGFGHEAARYIMIGGMVHTTTILPEEDLDRSCVECHDMRSKRRGKLRGS